VSKNPCLDVTVYFSQRDMGSQFEGLI